MSWQAYIDSNLLGTKKINLASIIGHDGTTWATSAGFAISPAEGKKIVAAFGNPADIISSGLWVAGKKYLALKYDSRSIYGKQGTTGVIVVKTKQAVIIGVYTDPSIQPGEATVVVEKLADYLISVNY